MSSRILFIIPHTLLKIISILINNLKTITTMKIIKIIKSKNGTNIDTNINIVNSFNINDELVLKTNLYLLNKYENLIGSNISYKYEINNFTIDDSEFISNIMISNSKLCDKINNVIRLMNRGIIDTNKRYNRPIKQGVIEEIKIENVMKMLMK